MSRAAYKNREARMKRKIQRLAIRRIHVEAAQRGRAQYAKDHPEKFGRSTTKRHKAFVEEGVWP